MKKLITLVVSIALALSLALAAQASAGVLQEYAGRWAGSVDNITLAFVIEADGTGMYTFEQAGYAESYPFTLSVESERFSVAVPEDNRLGIATCEGGYAYADGVLTLDVETTFAAGGTFAYTVPCTRVETPDGAAMTVVRAPVPKGGVFSAVILADGEGNEIVLPGDPAAWFENAAYVGCATPDPDGWLNGISIDDEAGEVLMVEGGDRLNLTFVVDGAEIMFSFGPGAQIAMEATEDGYLLSPAETMLLSPPQTEPVSAAYAARVE